MWFWLGTIDLFLLPVLITLVFKLSRALAPIFEKEAMLRDVAHFPGYPFYWLEGRFLCGARYAMAVAMIALTPAHMLEREQATLPCTKAEFLQHFSAVDIRRAVVFTILALAWLAIGITGSLLMPPEDVSSASQ